ncbi:hypothetical protein [Flagellimonas sp. SN16]|uniref:hypothetical protein n=1 Tax=Flagellimonas sp. SN16 TaxID=3415142 RepID=UPI003C3B6F08
MPRRRFFTSERNARSFAKKVDGQVNDLRNDDAARADFSVTYSPSDKTRAHGQAVSFHDMAPEENRDFGYPNEFGTKNNNTMETIKKEFKGTKDWEVSKYENDSSGRSCYRINESKGMATIEELEANAKLIEAAPDLLEALQQINIDLNILKKNILYESERLENTRFDGYADVIGSWISLNEQAIEKAL